MRRGKFLICFIMGLFVAVFPVSLIGGETKLSMLLWNRYTNETVGGELNANGFTLERGYLRIEPTITDRIDGRFNLDFFSDENSNTGAGVRVKYAYLNFAGFVPVPESNIRAGIIQHYFGFGYDWEYITIEQVLEEVEGVSKSADYGIALCGNFPGNKGIYSFSILNGEGYSNTGMDLDNTPEFLGNIRIMPNSGLTFGGSVLFENDDSDRLAYIGLGRFDAGLLEIRGEYLVQDKNDIKSDGFMIMPIVKLKEISDIDVDLVGRFDMWDANADVDNDGHKRIIGGLNWNIIRDANDKPRAMLQVQMEKTIFESDLFEDVTQLLVQLQWGFSNTFNQ